MADQSFKPVNGTWSMNKKHLEKPQQLITWIIVNMTKIKCPNLEPLVAKLTNYGRCLGLPISKPKMCVDIHPYNKLDQQLSNIKEQNRDLQILFFIISDQVDQPYIKTYCNDVLNIPSQCIKQNTLNRILQQNSFDVLLNICLSINAKIGGTNVCLMKSVRPQILETATMIMGADVNHSAPGSSNPSIASVVGSMDYKYCHFTVHHSQQEGRVEIIEKLDSFTWNLLNSFNMKNKRFPKRILFFRDGVGKGQYQQVKDKELRLIKEACKQIGCEPSISFIIVTKRHNTRFSPVSAQDGIGKSGNIPPGTTIDRVLCHPNAFEFYQCDHLGIMGTSKPTKYSVIFDENELTASILQVLIYFLCHTYAYCTKSISIPAAVQYAHNDAYHGKDFTLADVGKKSDSASASKGYFI